MVSSSAMMFFLVPLLSVFPSVQSTGLPDSISSTITEAAGSGTIFNVRANFTGIAEFDSMKYKVDLHHRMKSHRFRNRKVLPGGGGSLIPMPADLIQKNDRKIYLNHAAKEFLDAHNALRKFFGEKPFTWNKNLANYARQWSEKLRHTCAMEHSGGPYGENIFWGSGNKWRAVDAVQNWAMEHYYYDRNRHSCLAGRMCGHYTQIIWKESSSLGCAKKKCKQGGTVIVCSYDPPGNFVGENPLD